jgi:Glu-tRNA(Gln) amidotransferase subunit E-like FAD-binding protein
MKDEHTRKEHESFGLAGFSRVSTSGENRLFGSYLSKHPETILLRIHSATVDHHLAHDWFHADKELIEVELSPSQFAEMLTSMNRGDGVPCTIRRYNGKHIEDVPREHEMEQAKIYKGFAGQMHQLAANFKERRARLDELLSKKALSKADREEIHHMVFDVFQWFESNASFQLESFEEAADKVVNHAKAQVDAFVTGVLTRAGLEALRERFATIQKADLLPKHEDTK